MRNKSIIFAISIVCLTIGWLFGARYAPQEDVNPPSDVRENSPKYSFINPLLFSRSSKNFFTAEFQSLNDSLQASITSIVKANMATSVSVYFRDLNTGHWTGINEDKTYHPSSMLKVLGLMSYLRKAEEDPSFLSKKLYYKAEVDQGQHYAPQHILSTGLHTVDELLEQTIKYSDNAVLNILDASDKDNIFNKAYHTFELPLASNVDDIDGFMSPRSYSALFRTLYNGTYLSRDDSEKALQLLTQTDFNVGLVAGLPAGVPVAHKFGEHTYGLANDQIVRRELHDCGIVYYPGHPYLICVMTEGADFSSLEKAISSLSKTVYMYVDKNINKEVLLYLYYGQSF